jgi:hypothetical protein
MHSLTGVIISKIVIIPSSTKIVVPTPTGLDRAFPVAAFQLTEKEEAAN